MADLQQLFSPKSVAIIGASEKKGKIGHAVISNVITSGYQGRIYPVNPTRREILGLPCYPRVTDVPGEIDTAVIVTPAATVVELAEECGQKGVRFLVVITAGFKEIGRGDLEKELAATCRRYGMRLMGPNCLGFIDTHTPINASFAGQTPLPGQIAFFSQSGALCLAILDWSLAENLGFSKFVSIGNKADLHEADFLRAAVDDPETRVILCYLEDVADGRTFLEAARYASQRKPVIVLKSGVSQAGARAASSHTGALAGSDLAYANAFRQTGVIRAANLEELFDLARIFISQPRSPGRRVAVVTNSGGPGILATDAVEQQGLEMARFRRETSDALREGLPAEASVYNPVDVLGDASADRYELALRQVLADPQVDSYLVIFTPQATTQARDVAERVVAVHREVPAKPLVAAFIGGEAVASGKRLLEEAGIPVYISPERAVRVLEALYRYGRVQNSLRERQPVNYPDTSPEQVRQILAGVRRDGRTVLLGSEAAAVTDAYGIATLRSYLAGNPEEAVDLATRVGYPVVLKVASPRIAHKTDVGGVRTGLRDAVAVRQAFIEILENVHRLLPEVEVYGVEVQAMREKGTEVIVGMNRDQQFGPLLMFGLGGIYVNLIKDVSFRLAANLSREEIKEMLQETKAYQLLRGYRGQPPGDVDALVETIGRVAVLVRDFPEIVEMDINPLFVYEKGVAAVDVKMTLNFNF